MSDDDNMILVVLLAILGTFVILALWSAYAGWALWQVWNDLLPWRITYTQAVAGLFAVSLLKHGSYKKDDRPTDWAALLVAVLWPLIVVAAVRALT
jgi:hypothetical protein